MAGPIATATISTLADELLRYRSEFPILDRTTYLISNSLGAMPRRVADALRHYTELWSTRGVRAWEDKWWMLAAQVRRNIFLDFSPFVR